MKTGIQAMGMNRKILEVNNLYKSFIVRKGLLKRIVTTIKAVDGISFEMYKGETLALVGESGCGKTTTGRCIMRAIEPSDGKVVFNLNDEKENLDILSLDSKELKTARKQMAMIFQDPFSSLNPRLNILRIIGEPFITYKMVTKRKELEERVAALLEMVKLNPDYMQRYPHAFSGGQRQRIAIARALALDPKFIVADECVSALDVSVQAQILILLKELQTRLGLTYLFIAHNLAVVEYFSNRVAVMYVGKIVELTDTSELFFYPKHPYTEALLSAVPKADPSVKKKRIRLKGEIANPADPPAGCYFHPRCPYVKNICKEEQPPLVNINSNTQNPHYVACHFHDSLSLSGLKK